MPSHDAAYFAVVVLVPLLARLLTVPRIGEPVRAWSLALGERVWAHLAERSEPDDQVLGRWALVRLTELEGHLARVERLLGRDEDWSATRQHANRLAHARLLTDVAEARATAPPRPVEPPAEIWTAYAPVRSVLTPTYAPSGGVEVLEF